MKRILLVLVLSATLPLLAEWESGDWLRLTDVSFETYEAEQYLDATNGAHHGHWEAPVPLKELGVAKADGATKYMRIEALSTNLTFVSERPGRTGGGNVLLFTVRTSACTDLAPLSPDSKGGFAVATGDSQKGVAFCGWRNAGWCELQGATVKPTIGESCYDVALRFRDHDGFVQVQYLVKNDKGVYEVLTLPGSDVSWLYTNVMSGHAAVEAVDFLGVGGLECLSSREKNGFSVRLR